MIPASAQPPQARRRTGRVLVHSLVAGVAALAAAGSAGAAGLADRAAIVRVADRCSLYGAGFVDIGDGTCARVVHQYVEPASEPVGNRVRAEMGRRDAGGTAHAAMRSEGPRSDGMRFDGSGMLPDAVDAGHLRVPGALYAPR